MNGQVPVLSIIFMCISCLTAFLLPFGLLLYFRIRKKADILPFFIGCAVMLLFAYILEQLAHSLILGSSAGSVIQGSSWLYAIYGGMMAGLFEETGRFLAFKTVLRSRQDKDQNALMYGAGHGGFEAITVLGIPMINNIIYSVFLNTGHAGTLTGTLSGEALTRMNEVFSTLVSTSSGLFLLGAAERILAIILQIAFSVLVWFSVKQKNRRYLYPAAIGLHFIVDAVTVLLSRNGMSAAAVEGMVCILTVICALFAWFVWNRCHIIQSQDGS
jgi:uncharacterized membrane protein YhfC